MKGHREAQASYTDDELSGWLTQHRPPTFLPGIMHGDFHMANLMFRNDGPQVAAIVDWEMCTLGDPLLDLGWLLATWPQDGAIGVSAVSGGATGMRLSVASANNASS